MLQKKKKTKQQHKYWIWTGGLWFSLFLRSGFVPVTLLSPVTLWWGPSLWCSFLTRGKSKVAVNLACVFLFPQCHASVCTPACHRAYLSVVRVEPFGYITCASFCPSSVQCYFYLVRRRHWMYIFPCVLFGKWQQGCRPHRSEKLG